MKLTIESTADLTTIHGVPVRVWKGTTEAGTEVVVLVRQIAVPIGAPDEAAIAKELQEQLPPPELCRARALYDVLLDQVH